MNKRNKHKKNILTADDDAEQRELRCEEKANAKREKEIMLLM